MIEKIKKPFLHISLACALFLGIFLVLPSNEVHAQLGGAIACNDQLNSSTGGSQTVPVADDVVEKATKAQKEMKCKYDGFGWVAAKAVVSGLTSSIVNWINSGYKGGPSFVTNPEIFFANVADNVSGDFLSKNGNIAKYLCSPFSVDIRLALALGQTGRGSGKPYACSLSTIINNAKGASINGNSIEGFVNGDFSQGGWAGFVSLSQSQNNASGAYLQAHSDLLEQIGLSQNKYAQQLNQGLGFLSNEKCDASGKNCHVTTPGSFIGSTLNKSSQAGFDALGVADSIDEILGAVLQNFLSDALTGGVTGASEKRSGQTQSLLQQLQHESTHPAQLPSIAKDIADSYGPYITKAQSAADKYSAAVLLYSSVNDTIALAQSCYLSLANSGNTGVQSTLLEIAGLAERATASTTVLQNKRDLALANLTKVKNAANATANSTDLNDLQNNSQSLQAFLSTQTPAAIDQSTKDAQKDFDAAKKRTDTFDEKGAGYLKSCQKLGGNPTITVGALRDEKAAKDAAAGQ